MGISIITSQICDVFGLNQGNAIVAGECRDRDGMRARLVSKWHAAKRFASRHITRTRYATAATAAASYLHRLATPMWVPQRAVVRTVSVPRVSVVRT